MEFYVNELTLFEVAEDLGRGNVFLRYIRSEDFYLMLSLELGGEKVVRRYSLSGLTTVWVSIIV
ncbi:hypothetical protein WL61_19710 [Burkholderia ubonensis]|nr:hypothetical protein WJ80_09665 [Burkholderia ubonensis]KVR32151.1 hypothetical protein WK14_01295 [Burkholderia ubonensis]KWD19794.1 hypothetical protein WL61_19710 [Burkholderia ubonensis]KWD27178.1 hypothetical protein WL62_09060 [Burkholderia ubonensis]